MKKIFLSTLILFVAVVGLQAQGFRAGVKLGAIGTKIDGQSFEDGYQLSYQAGIFTEIDFNKKFGIQPELLFSQTASKTVSGLNPITSELFASRNVKLNYLSILIFFSS
ncbi:MAG: outer membrane beta-barrel protein [Chitinophagaceae bacterium]